MNRVFLLTRLNIGYMMLIMVSKINKASRRRSDPDYLMVRGFPAELRRRCKAAALANGETLRDWLIRVTEAAS